MKSGTRMPALVILLLFVLSIVPPSPGRAQTPLGNYITYQGDLQDGGNPANGLYDLQFALFDAEFGGNQIGPTISLENVPVTAGAFSVTLDFGPKAFTGDARWIESAVRPGADTGAYTVLAPRRGITPVPYAIRSHSSFQLTEDFVVAPGQSINAGDVVGLESIGSERIVKGSGIKGIGLPVPTGDVAEVIALTSSTLVLATGTKARVGTVSGSSISLGPLIPAPGVTSDEPRISMSKLSSTRAVFCYINSADTRSSAAVGDVEGDSINFGLPAPFGPAIGVAHSSFGRGGACASLSSDTFVAAASFIEVISNSLTGANSIAVGTVNGNTVSFGATVPFSAQFVGLIHLVSLSPTQVVLTCEAVTGYPNSIHTWNVIIGTVSGSNISFGSLVASPIGSAGRVIVPLALSATKFVLLSYQGPEQTPVFAIGTVTGDAFTLGPQFISELGGGDAMAALSPNQFVSYGNAASDAQDGIVIQVSGDSMAITNQFHTPLPTYGVTAVALSSEKFVLNQGTIVTPEGAAVVGTMPVSIVPPLGIAKTPGIAGDRIPVIVKGVSDVHSGLIPGRTYYSDDNGVVQLVIQQVKVGLAISPTRILLEGGLPLNSAPSEQAF